MIRSYVRNCIHCGSNHWIEHEPLEPHEGLGGRYIVRYDCPLTGRRSSFWKMPPKNDKPTHGAWL